MSNLTTTNNDLGNVILQDPKFRDETLTVAGAQTILEGTLLARKQVADAVVAAPVGGNTGDGTVTVASVVPGPIIPLVGIYNLICTAAVTNGGVFKLVDPNGAIVATGLTMTPGAGGATIIEVAGLIFTITDAAADFIAGDSFTLTVAADGKLVVYATAGSGGAQIPLALITYPLTTTGGGDNVIRAGVSGSYRSERLVIDADGDASNITDAIRDQLRNYGLVPIDVQELNIQDNQ